MFKNIYKKKNKKKINNIQKIHHECRRMTINIKNNVKQLVVWEMKHESYHTSMK